MTTLECIGTPFIYRWPHGCIRLAPGSPVTLPDERAARVLTKMPGRVKVIAVDQSRIGHIIHWESPMHGFLRATVLEDLEASGVLVMHPLTDQECLVPVGWLRTDGGLRCDGDSQYRSTDGTAKSGNSTICTL